MKHLFAPDTFAALVAQLHNYLAADPMTAFFLVAVLSGICAAIANRWS